MQATYQGSLFSSDFLTESIARLSDWSAIDAAAVDAFAARLGQIFARFPTSQSPNESQTEDDLIWPVLETLGWTVSLRQQNLTPKGREDVPDGLLFKDAAAKAQANRSAEEWRRYDFGLAIVESIKRKAAIGIEEPIEGQAGEARRPFQGAQQLQAGGGAGAVEPAEWRDHRGHHGGDRLAGAYGAWLPGCGSSEETRAAAGIREDGWRTRLSGDWQA